MKNMLVFKLKQFVKLVSNLHNSVIWERKDSSGHLVLAACAKKLMTTGIWQGAATPGH